MVLDKEAVKQVKTLHATFTDIYFNMNFVVEYDKDFKEIWRYSIMSPWAAMRLKNGNTLITDEKENLTREVNTRGETVWEFNCKTDLPAEYQFASAPQTCTRLANATPFSHHVAREAKARN
ncbi:MAG: hypothetical protein WKF70_14815 [Chitinophagaceae bacterium]